MSNHIVTGEVRLSFAHLFEPHAPFTGQEAKYSAMILIRKDDKATLKTIRDAQQDALERGKVSLFGGEIPKNWKNTLRDGDAEMDTEKYPEVAGHYFMNVNNKRKPGVVDTSLNPIMDASEIYSGCYVKVALSAYPFNASGNKGASFGLEHVQKLRDGDSLGGASSKPEDVFSVVSDDDAELI